MWSNFFIWFLLVKFSCLLFYLVWFSVVRFILLLVVGQICCWLFFSFHFFYLVWFGWVWSRRSNKSQPSFGPFNHRPALPYLPQHYFVPFALLFVQTLLYKSFVKTTCTSLFAPTLHLVPFALLFQQFKLLCPKATMYPPAQTILYKPFAPNYIHLHLGPLWVLFLFCATEISQTSWFSLAKHFCYLYLQHW